MSLTVNGFSEGSGGSSVNKFTLDPPERVSVRPNKTEFRCS